ncbi:hypothetical protein ACFYPT_40895 [Streptomyces sp. NPDC005529]|uniref:hypothetical protein n=1 Tax=unclassified Streptomyces TaxID=2593676 RepID=UPI0033ABEE4B
MTSPLDPAEDDDGIPPYTAPAWYTNPLVEGSPDGPIPWHAVGAAGTELEQEPACHVCRAQPVVTTSISSHTGLILGGRSRTVTEPLCRQCGIALVRVMTTRTLWRGWWGVLSLLIHTPAVLVVNAGAYRQFKRLPVSAPQRWRPALVLGRPVLCRPQAYVALIPVAGAAALLILILLLHR